jgi:hypothetical protein
MAPNDGLSLRALALKILGSSPQSVSRALPSSGTAKIQSVQEHNASVPLSQTLAIGTVGQSRNLALGAEPPHRTALGQSTVPAPYVRPLAVLQARCPAGVEESRWRQTVEDAVAFLSGWGKDSATLGWTSEELFGLHPIAPLARYDAMGLVWLLRGRAVVALTEGMAAIQTPSGGTLSFYRAARRARALGSPDGGAESAEGIWPR